MSNDFRRYSKYDEFNIVKRFNKINVLLLIRNSKGEANGIIGKNKKYCFK